MKLTPLDIHHKEFRHALRGYNEEEVDHFLDEVADEFERLFKENIDLSEKLEAANEKVRGYVEIERTLHNTMVSAQRSAEDIVGKAHTEADMVLRDAEVKAKEIIHTALSQKQKSQAELMRIKQAEEEFRSRFRSMLEDYLRHVREISLPDDVKVLAGRAGEEMLGEVEVAPETVERLAAAPEPGPTPERTEERQPAEVPSSGFVSGLHLGETAAPDDLPLEPSFPEPTEFTTPSFGSLGEREDDVDIEEID